MKIDVELQLPFLPERPPKLVRRKIDLVDLIGDPTLSGAEQLLGEAPKAAFVRSVRRFGVLIPVLVTESDTGAFRLQDGRRRVRALVEIWRSEPSGRETVKQWRRRWGRVPAVIVRSDWWFDGTIALVANEQRRDNIAVALLGIETLAARGLSEQEIVRGVGMSRLRMRRLMRLGALNYALRAELDAGRLTDSVAECAAGLPAVQQVRLAQIARERRLTAKDVREVKGIMSVT